MKINNVKISENKIVINNELSDITGLAKGTIIEFNDILIELFSNRSVDAFLFPLTPAEITAVNRELNELQEIYNSL